MSGILFVQYSTLFPRHFDIHTWRVFNIQCRTRTVSRLGPVNTSSQREYLFGGDVQLSRTYCDKYFRWYPVRMFQQHHDNMTVDLTEFFLFKLLEFIWPFKLLYYNTSNQWNSLIWLFSCFKLLTVKHEIYFVWKQFFFLIGRLSAGDTRENGRITFTWTSPTTIGVSSMLVLLKKSYLRPKSTFVLFAVRMLHRMILNVHTVSV